jgi:hypothetical protein
MRPSHYRRSDWRQRPLLRALRMTARPSRDRRRAQPGHRWRLIPTQANGQPAFDSHFTDDGGGRRAEGSSLALNKQGGISAGELALDPLVPAL